MTRTGFPVGVIRTGILAVFLMFGGVAAVAQADEIYTGTFDDVAIDGTDTVAYHTQGVPVEGSDEFTHEWRGATWYFASAENRDLFAADPEAYAPQYGGFCAYAVSQGYTASTVPEAWDIVDGKLYLNYSLGVQDRWRGDRDNYITAADENWPGIREGL